MLQQPQPKDNPCSMLKRRWPIICSGENIGVSDLHHRHLQLSLAMPPPLHAPANCPLQRSRLRA
jgi:hypothetical protein